MVGKRLSTIAVLSVNALCASLLAVAVAPPAEAAGPKQLVFTGQPASATGGSAFDPPAVVEVQDSATGTTVASNETVTLSIATGPAGATLTCDDLAVDAVDGVATFAGCAIDLVGTYELLATSASSDPGTSASFDVAVGPASEVLFTNDPTDITAGEAFATPPAMAIVDAGGNPVDPADHTFGLAVLDSEELPINLIACTGGREVNDLGVVFHSTTPAGGEASFPDCSVAVAGTGYTLVGVVVPVDDTLPAVTGFSAPFDVHIGPAAELAFATQPSGGLAGAELPRQPVVAIQDGYGNTVPGVTDTIELTVEPAAPFTCTGDTQADAADGLATFSGCAVQGTGTFTMVAGAPGGGFPDVTSSQLVLTSGAPATLGFLTQPGGGTAGQPLDPQPSVELLDAAGLRVNGSVELTLDGGPADATIECTTDVAPTIAGVVELSGCSLDRPGTYQLVATESSTGVAATSASVEVTTGPAVATVFSDVPTDVAAGQPFPLSVALHDAGGNIADVTDQTIRLVMTSVAGRTGGRLACTGGADAASVSGVGSFSGCTIDRPGTYRLTAHSPTGVAVSPPIAVALGAPADLTFISAPAMAIDGGLLATPQLRLRDAAGNVVDAEVTLAASGGSLTGCATSVMSRHGIAAFPGCVVGSASSTLTLTATAAGASAVVDVPVSTEPPVGTTAATMTLGETFGDDDPSVVTHDVNGATGALQLQTTDLEVAGVGVPLVFERRYNSLDDGGGLLGPGWSTPVDVGVTYAEDGTATLRTHDGRILSLVPGPDCGGGGGPGIVGRSLLQRAADSVDEARAIRSDTWLDKAADELADALEDRNWDGDHLVAARGNHVFTDLEKAMQWLEKALDTSGLPADAADAARSAQDDLIEVSRQLVDARLADLEGLDLQDPDDQQDRDAAIERAEGHVQLAEEDLAQDDLRMAIKQFGKAWKELDAAVDDLEDRAGNAKRLATGGSSTEHRSGGGTTGDATCGYEGPASSDTELTCDGTTCTVVTDDGTTMTLVDGRLQSLTSDLHGDKGLVLGYDGAGGLSQIEVATTAGPPVVVDVTTDPDGRVTELRTPTRTVSYTYDGGLLTQVTDPAGNTTTFDHDTDGRITDRTLGDDHLQVTYAPDGRVATADRTGQQTPYSDTYGWSVDGTSGIGTSTRHTAVTAHGAPDVGVWTTRFLGNVLLSEEAPDGATTAYSHDESLNLIARQDPMGYVERWTHNADGDITSQVDGAGAITELSYDEPGQVSRIVDPVGNTTDIVWVDGRISWIVPPDPVDPQNLPGDPDTVGTNLLYDADGLLTEVRTPRRVTTHTSDTSGNQTGFQTFDRSDVARENPLNGNGPLLTHDEAGNVLTEVDPRGHLAGGSVDPAFQTTHEYDPNGRLVRTTRPGRGTTTATYTPAGDIASLDTPEHGLTTYTWDEPTRVRTASGGLTGSWGFGPLGNLLHRVNRIGRTIESLYDAGGRLVAEIDPANVRTSYVRNAAGAVVAVEDSAGGSSSISYGPSSRPVQVEVDGQTESRGYDLAGRVTSITDATGVTTTYEFNNHGLLAALTDAAGTTSYVYDDDEHLIATTDGNGRTRSFTNDADGRRTSMTFGGNEWTFAYDAAGNLVSTTDPDGRTTAVTVDPAGQVTAIQHSQPGQPTIDVTQQFDLQGRRIGMTDPTGSHSFSYDDRGNLTATQSPTGSFAYDYTEPGSMTQTYPDGTRVRYRYDDHDFLMGLEAPGVDVAYVRDEGRLVTAIAFGNGLAETRSYEAGQLVGQELRCGIDTVMSQRYGHDDVHRPLGAERTVAGLTITSGHGYDSTGRVVAGSTATTGTPTVPGAGCPVRDPAPGGAPGTPAEGAPPLPDEVADPVATAGLTGLVPSTANPIVYDAVGNRLSADGVDFTYGSGDELLAGSDGRSMTYDGAGNLTSMVRGEDTYTYRYDAASRLVEVQSVFGHDVSYVYDGDGNRVRKTLSGEPQAEYAWDLSGSLPLLALETDPLTGSFQRYFHGVGPVAIQTATQTRYLHTDRRQDVVAVSDETGAVVETYTYDAFGDVVSSTGPVPSQNPLRFGGQYLDVHTGLYNLRARQYDPEVGRFTQRDPVVAPVGVPVVSAYVYANNQPTVLGDFDGRFPGPFDPDPRRTSDSNKATNIARGVTLGSLPVKAGFEIAEAFTGFPAGAPFGAAVSIVGIGLSTYVAVDDCMNGPPELCAASVTAAVFNLGCTFVGGGVTAVGCAVAGAALSYVISEYGPEIVEFLDEEITKLAKDLEPLARAISPFGLARAVGNLVDDYGPDVLAAFSDGGAIATGFNDAASWISSGFDDFVDVLTDAGLAALPLTELVLGVFGLTDEEAFAVLIVAAYELEEIAEAAGALFSSAGPVAAFFRDLGYDLGQVGQALNSFFTRFPDWNEAAFAAALSGVGYLFDEIATGLRDVFGADGLIVAEIAAALNIDPSTIADVLSGVFTLDATSIAQVFLDVGFTPDAIAGALKDTFDAGVEEVVGVLADIGTLATDIGPALEGLFTDAEWTAGILAEALSASGFPADQIVTSVVGTFRSAPTIMTNILTTLGVPLQLLPDLLVNSGGYQAADALYGMVASGVPILFTSRVFQKTFPSSTRFITDALSSAGIDLSSAGGYISNTAEDVVETIDPRNWCC